MQVGAEKRKWDSGWWFERLAECSEWVSARPRETRLQFVAQGPGCKDIVWNDGARTVWKGCVTCVWQMVHTSSAFVLVVSLLDPVSRRAAHLSCDSLLTVFVGTTVGACRWFLFDGFWLCSDCLHPFCTGQSRFFFARQDLHDRLQTTVHQDQPFNALLVALFLFNSDLDIFMWRTANRITYHCQYLGAVCGVHVDLSDPLNLDAKPVANHCKINSVNPFFPPFAIPSIVSHIILGWSLIIYLYIYRSIHLSIYRSIDLSIYPSFDLSMYPSTHLSTYHHLSIYPAIHVSIYPSFHLSIYPSIHQSLFIDLSIHPSIYHLYIVYLLGLYPDGADQQIPFRSHPEVIQELRQRRLPAIEVSKMIIRSVTRSDFRHRDVVFNML